MKCVSLRGNIARYALRSPSVYLYLHPSLQIESGLEVGELVRVALLQDVYDGVDVWSEESQWWRGRVRFRFQSALTELPRSLLLKDVPGYRSVSELRRTLSRMARTTIDEWDTVEVVCVEREDYDLSRLNEMLTEDRSEG